MAWDDPVTDGQLGLIRGAARSAIPDLGEYHGEAMYEHLDPLVLPVYGCRVQQMNRGQASLLIDNLMYLAGESEKEPESGQII